MDCVTSPPRIFLVAKTVDIQLVWTHQGLGEDSKKRETVQINSQWEVPCLVLLKDVVIQSTFLTQKKRCKTKAFCVFSTHQPMVCLFSRFFLGCCSNHQFALRHVLQLHDFWIIALLWKVIVEHHIIRKVDPTKGPKKGIVMFPENLRVFLKPTRFVCVWFPPKKKNGALEKRFKKNGWEQRGIGYIDQKRKDSLRWIRKSNFLKMEGRK